MITKADVLKCSIKNFTQFGSKTVTLTDLSKLLGISKKTIYQYFDSKEDLVTQSVDTLLQNYQADIDAILGSCHDPIECIILIYKRGFEIISNFKPSFLYGLKKYYPAASDLFDRFRAHLSSSILLNLLEEAQDEGIIESNINIELVTELNFTRLNNHAFKQGPMFDLYPAKTILYYLIICNLKGIVKPGYQHPLFELSLYVD